MPPEEMWRDFFDPAPALKKLGLTRDLSCVVDFGCGYGTFAIPAAQMTSAAVHAIDIDPEMIAATRGKALSLGLSQLHLHERDFVAEGCGLPDVSADYVMQFNLLHAAEATQLLLEAYRILRPNGILGVMHWNYTPSTPRGPSMAIRLQPRELLELVERAGFAAGELVDLPPFHYGFIARKI